MTKQDAAEALTIIAATYPNYKPNKAAAVEVWASIFSNVPYDSVKMAVTSYIASDDKGFAPVPGQIIGILKAISEGTTSDTAAEAWEQVRGAMMRGSYLTENGYSWDTEFAKLPPLVQRCVGSPGSLEEWAHEDSKTTETVHRSNFMRTYTALSQKEESMSRFTPEAKARIPQREAYRLPEFLEDTLERGKVNLTEEQIAKRRADIENLRRSLVNGKVNHSA